MAAPYDKYLVTNIFYDNSSINIVDTDLASGKCNLPSQAITLSFFPFTFTPEFSLGENPDPLHLADYFGWVAFINCSEKIESIYFHGIVPCLSQNNRFIYLVDTAIISLAISCSYVTMVPIMFPDEDLYNIGDGILGIMKNGFTLSWSRTEKITRSKIIRDCLTQVVPQATGDMKELKKVDRIRFPFLIEAEFVYCIKETHDLDLYGYSIVFVVFLDIVSFYLEEESTLRNENIGVMSDVLLQLSTLCNANFLCKSGSFQLDVSTRYQSTIDEELALKVAKSINFPLSKYMYR